MAIQLRLIGEVTADPRRFTYTPSGRPRFTFGVRVGGLRKRKFRVTAYGTQAKFADLYLREGQRIRIEGAYLRRVPCYDGAVRADSVRHVGTATPPPTATIVRFVPAPITPTERASAARERVAEPVTPAQAPA